MEAVLQSQILQFHRLMLVPEGQQLGDGMIAGRIALRGERIFGESGESAFDEEGVALRDSLLRGREADPEFREAPHLRQRDEIQNPDHRPERPFRLAASRREDWSFLTLAGAGIRLMILDGRRRGTGARQ
jgi:hypothetical protein